jgi:hypothetical protein
MEVVKTDARYEVQQDVKGQLKFLEELDKLERRRHSEIQREMLLKAAKSRSKAEDPEQAKLKAKAKEVYAISFLIKFLNANKYQLPDATSGNGGIETTRSQYDGLASYWYKEKAQTRPGWYYRLLQPGKNQISRVYLQFLLFILVLGAFTTAC